MATLEIPGPRHCPSLRRGEPEGQLSRGGRVNLRGGAGQLRRPTVFVRLGEGEVEERRVRKKRRCGGRWDGWGGGAGGRVAA